MDKEQLLAEVEDVLRTMPPYATIRHPTPANDEWLGRALAVVKEWNTGEGVGFQIDVNNLHGVGGQTADRAIRGINTKLFQARADLQMKTRGPLNRAVDRGRVFDYFDEVRQTIQTAKQDLFFVDPYLDADFISRYMPHVTDGVRVRLLGREKMATLVPATKMFAQQHPKVQMEIRSAANFHDRYVFIDQRACYQSGASFKDGAKTAPTTLTQITDAFQPMLDTYERIWTSATPVA